jgi:hypothetical protein
MSKLMIVDLTNEVELSSAAMSKIGGGMSCEAGQVISDTYKGIGDILSILGNVGGSTEMYGRATGVLQGACNI